MKLNIVEAQEIFPQLAESKSAANAAKFKLPQGEFDMDDEADKKLSGFVPAEDPYYRFQGAHLIPLLLLFLQKSTQEALLYGELILNLLASSNIACDPADCSLITRAKRNPDINSYSKCCL
jgi:hypothetical protein